MISTWLQWPWSECSFFGPLIFMGPWLTHLAFEKIWVRFMVGKRKIENKAEHECHIYIPTVFPIHYQAQGRARTQTRIFQTSPAVFSLPFIVFRVNVDQYVFHSWCNLGSFYMAEGGGRRWRIVSLSLYQVINQTHVFTLHVVCIQFTFRIKLSPIVVSLIHLDITVSAQSWLHGASPSPGAPHGSWERLGASGFASLIGIKHTMTNSPGWGW